MIVWWFFLQSVPHISQSFWCRGLYIYVTWSREMSHMSKTLNFELLTPLSSNLKMLCYEQFVSTENNIKQMNLNSFFANISKTIYATSDSFPLIMSHIGSLTLSTWQAWSDDTTTIITNLFQKIKKCEIWYLYLKSPWGMHLN